jgi:hypothetical protein
VSEVDFTTVLGRLLRDGALRDEFAVRRAQTMARLGVSEAHRDIFLNLNSADLEFQARVLLRKRFDSVLQLLPITCARLDQRAWPLFHDYARAVWPDGPRSEVQDACNFCERLLRENAVDVSRRELNRLRFGISQSLCSMHWRKDIVIRHKKRIGLQILLRRRGSIWREYVFYLAF